MGESFSLLSPFDKSHLRYFFVTHDYGCPVGPFSLFPFWSASTLGESTLWYGCTGTNENEAEKNINETKREYLLAAPIKSELTNWERNFYVSRTTQIAHTVDERIAECEMDVRRANENSNASESVQSFTLPDFVSRWISFLAGISSWVCVCVCARSACMRYILCFCIENFECVVVRGNVMAFAVDKNMRRYNVSVSLPSQIVCSVLASVLV